MSLLSLVGDNVLTRPPPSRPHNSPPLLPGNGGGSFIFAAPSTAQSATSPTLDVKVQECDDAATWTDVTGLTLTQITAANSQRLAFGHSAKKFVRLVGTVGGSATPTVTATVS